MRSWMKNTVATGLAAVCAVSAIAFGFGLQPHRPLTAKPSQHELTAEDARNALIDLLRRNPTAFQRELDPNELARQPLIELRPGTYQLDGFLIQLPAAIYQITIRYGECIFEYEGDFHFEVGRWVASQPHWTSAAYVK